METDGPRYVSIACCHAERHWAHSQYLIAEMLPQWGFGTMHNVVSDTEKIEDSVAVEYTQIENERT